jgi:hypothetical protein
MAQLFEYLANHLNTTQFGALTVSPRDCPVFMFLYKRYLKPHICVAQQQIQ